MSPSVFDAGSAHVTRVLLKGEVDLLRAFTNGPTRSEDGGRIEFIVERPARIELLDQQLSGSVNRGLPELWAPLMSTRAGDPDIDIVLLSLAGDLTRQLYHDPVSEALVDLATVDCEVGDLDPAPSDFERAARSVIERLQSAHGPLVMWLTASTVSGYEESHQWTQADRPFSALANKLNLAVARLSQQFGVCLLDADRLLAELGAREHVHGPFLYSDEASAQLAAEFHRIIADLAGSDRALASPAGSLGSE